MTLAEALLLAGLLILAVSVAVLAERQRRFRRELDQLRSESAARNASVAARRTHRASPGVDAAGRTTRRDSDDLPLTGRMSQGVQRVRRYGRTGSDDQLQ